MSDIDIDAIVARYAAKYYPNGVPEKVQPKREYVSKIVNTINVFDNLIFKNSFDYSKDYSEGKERSIEYSLNTFEGVVNVSKIHASRNIAYGQTDNGYSYIYINPKKNEILITIDLTFKSPTTGRPRSVKRALEEKRFISMGAVGGSLWRWMAANKSDVLKNEYSNNIPFMNKVIDACRIVEINDIKHGTWQIDHYYNTDDYGNFRINNVPIASHLKLI